MFIALGVAALIVISVIYYEAPAVLHPGASSTSGPPTYDSPTEYGDVFNCACSASPGIPPENASVLAESAYNSYPYQATPFVVGGISRQVGLGGVSYLANVGNYQIYAINIETQLAVYDVSIPNAPLTQLPEVTPYFHLEATRTIGGVPEVWLTTPWDGVYGFLSVGAVNANYGFNETIPAVGQDGNIGTYSYAAPNLAIDEPRSILVTGPSVNTTGIPGRGVVEGWKLGTKNATLAFGSTSFTVKSATELWQTYISPPQDSSASAWEIQQIGGMQHAWVFNGTGAVDLKTLSSSALQSVLANDWTPTSGSAVFSSGAESNSSWIADTANDVTYIATSAPQTSQPGSSFNGPALFSSSIIALKTTTGSLLWSFQFTPHDVWGWGCRGNIAMVDATVNGKTQQAIAKQCDNGYLYLLDPTTGALLYSSQVPGVARVDSAGIPNIMSPAQMQESYASLVSNSTATPIETNDANISYDASNKLLISAVDPLSASLGSPTRSTNTNSTAYAFDLSTLAFSWQAPIHNQQFSFIAIAAGVVYMGTYQGEILVASTVTGSLLQDIHAVQTVTSIMIMNGQHGQTGLVIAGHSVSSKYVVETELFTPYGASIAGPQTPIG